jgi:hypothetical protein
MPALGKNIKRSRKERRNISLYYQTEMSLSNRQSKILSEVGTFKNDVSGTGQREFSILDFYDE